MDATCVSKARLQDLDKSNWFIKKKNSYSVGCENSIKKIIPSFVASILPILFFPYSTELVFCSQYEDCYNSRRKRSARDAVFLCIDFHRLARVVFTVPTTNLVLLFCRQQILVTWNMAAQVNVLHVV